VRNLGQRIEIRRDREPRPVVERHDRRASGMATHVGQTLLERGGDRLEGVGRELVQADDQRPAQRAQQTQHPPDRQVAVFLLAEHEHVSVGQSRHLEHAAPVGV
jgi:hypothetical protein